MPLGDAYRRNYLSQQGPAELAAEGEGEVRKWSKVANSITSSFVEVARHNKRTNDNNNLGNAKNVEIKIEIDAN